MSSSNDLLERIEKSSSKIKEFGDLLDSLATTDDKKKMLWKQIYQNAVTDREAAHSLYTQLYMSMTGSAQEHTTLGTMLVRYLERMGKCNEQLIKLADMISAAEKEQTMTSEEMFQAIGD